MAKRTFRPFKEFNAQHKRVKLDVSVSRMRPETHMFSCSQLSNNFWDDDEDDVILLATQVAEQAINSKTTAAGNITETELTFSEFVPNVVSNGSTSTQCPAKPSIIPDQHELLQMFQNDSDFEVPKETKEQQIAKVCTAPNIANDEPSDDLNARRQRATKLQLNYLTNRVHALKTDNKRLHDDLTEAREKIQHKDGETSLLRDELRHLKQQVQVIKMQQLLNSEKFDRENKHKIAELSKQVEVKETELKLKRAECTVLKMRQAEISMRVDDTQKFDMNSSSSEVMDFCAETVVEKLEEEFENEVADVNEDDADVDDDVEDDVDVDDDDDDDDNAKLCIPKPDATSKRQKILKDFAFHRALTCLENISIKDTQENALAVASLQHYLHADTFEPTYKNHYLLKYRSRLQIELQKLQAVLAQLTGGVCTTLESLQADTIASVCVVFPELWTYVHTLQYPKNGKIAKFTGYNVLEDYSESMRKSLMQIAPLHEDEQVVDFRRYVAVLSAICLRMPKTAHALLLQYHGNYILLQIASEAITKLSFARNLNEHFGLLETFAALSCNLALHFPAQSSNAAEVLIELIKAIVFTRPSPYVLLEVSNLLIQATNIEQLLQFLCENSPEYTFRTDFVNLKYRFNDDSCLLQVYIGMLENAFPLHTPLSDKKFELFCMICWNHLRFVYYCFHQPPDFVLRHLPSHNGTSKEENNATATENSNSSENNSNTATSSVNQQGHTTTKCCQCYTRLCLGAVNLIFQLFDSWLQSNTKREISKMSSIAQLAVQVLYVIFKENYDTSLFYYTGESTKFNLYLICNWLHDHTELFAFNELHLEFLQLLRTAHFMPSELAEMENKNCDLEKNLIKWYEKSKDQTDNIEAEKVEPEEIIKNLQLQEDLVDEEKFYEFMDMTLNCVAKK